jgi:peptidoglycan/LPS O-acetylase OafA/YrhL
MSAPAAAPVSTERASLRRIPELDGLRAFAILPVMLHHCWPIIGWPRLVGEAGWMGVDLFFVLSGYLITGILRNGIHAKYGYRNFLARRALRIFPLYYVCLALFTAVAMLRPDHASWDAMKAWGGAGWFFVYLGNVRAAWAGSLPPVLSFATLWSLQVEEQYYLLFPIAVALLTTRNLRRFLAGCVLAAPLLRLALLLGAPDNSTAGYVLMPCRMDALAMGGILAILFQSPERPSASGARRAFFIGAGAVAFFLSSALRSGHSTAYDPWMRSLGYSVVDFTCAALLCWTLLATHGSLGALLRVRPLVYTGQIAYGLYLLHEPASWAARRLLSPLLGNIETHSVLSVPITFAASFLAAGLSWKIFESPILRWKNHFRMRE